MPLMYDGNPRQAADQIVGLEKAGLDLVWVAEAYGFDSPTLMGYLAAKTDTIQIGAGILNVFSRTPGALLQTAAGLDNVGGPILDRLLARTMEFGKVAVCGMAVGFELQTTVLPFVLRSVDVLGVNVSRTLKMAERVRLWQRLGSDLKPRHLDAITRMVKLEEIDATFDKFIDGSTVGHYVVEISPT